MQTVVRARRSLSCAPTVPDVVTQILISKRLCGLGLAACTVAPSFN